MSLTLTLARGGGEVSGTGTNITLAGTMEGGAIESVELNGDTEQTTYSGKNLANIRGDIIKSGAATVSVSGETITVTTSGGGAWCFVPLERVKISQQQTKISYQVEGNYQNVGVLFYYNTTHMGNITWLFNGAIFHSGDTVTFPDLSSYADVGVVVYANNANVSATGTTMAYKNIQLELGTSVTSYEPYVGGTASPNPDYPQEVQTVTGRQVVTISDGGSQSQSYTVDLGSIELCKIGTYQDYIYKSGEDWYVHKETGKYTLDGSLAWYVSGSCFKLTNLNTDLGYAPMNAGYVFYPATDSIGLWCNYGIAKSGYKVFQGTEKGVGLGVSNTGGGGADGIYVTGGSLTLENFQTMLNTSPLVCDYILDTPTDTQITNSALIAQLEALNAGTTYDGTTIITVASENLASPLEVKASATITKTYTEVEIGSPFTIADVEGKSSNTTLDGNVYVDWSYNKKQYSFDLFNLTPQDYADIRAFYDYQFNNSAFPTITVPELNIDRLPVYMEISSRNIINQCLLTDKLTIKFRETVQP